MVQIRIVAPASPRLECDKEGILQAFKQMGLEASFGAHTFDFERFMAGSDTHRAQDLMGCFFRSACGYDCGFARRIWIRPIIGFIGL